MLVNFDFDEEFKARTSALFLIPIIRLIELSPRLSPEDNLDPARILSAHELIVGCVTENRRAALRFEISRIISLSVFASPKVEMLTSSYIKMRA